MPFIYVKHPRKKQISAMWSLGGLYLTGGRNWWPATTGLGRRRRPGLPRTSPKGRRAVTGSEQAAPGAGGGLALDRPPVLLASGAGGVWRQGGGVGASRED
jgi:hypothetical protein